MIFALKSCFGAFVAAGAIAASVSAQPTFDTDPSVASDALFDDASVPLSSTNGIIRGGDGWSLDYGYLGCRDYYTTNCSESISTGVSPAAPEYYEITRSGMLTVRLIHPANAIFNLFVELQQSSGNWSIVEGSTVDGQIKNVTFPVYPPGRLRFKAWRASGSGDYTMNWKLEQKNNPQLCIPPIQFDAEVNNLL